ncbi:MAG: stage II sporulation protein M [Eubacteriales bacterium]|nr:stage II sporulation protein M [Eubacteriales bacterium]
MGKNKTIIFSAFIFLVGISSGVFLEIFMNPQDKLQMANFLSNYLFQTGEFSISYPAPFLSSAAGNLLLLLLIFMFGLSAIGFPAAYAVLLYKGAALGFTASIIIDSFALKGAASLCLTILPQNIIIIPVFILAAASAQQYGIDSILALRNKRGKINSGLRRTGRRYLITNLIFAAVIFFGCAIEALIALAYI